jgi:hypothetical protein
VTTLSPVQIYTLARGAGLSAAAATTATAVALAESGGRTDAMGDVGLEDAKWGPSVGVWQIRSLKAQSGTGQDRDATRLTDPAFNAKAMADISGAGKNFGAWSTYTSGAYKKHLGDVATGIVSNPGAGDPSNGTVAKNAISSLTSGWGADAMSIGLKILGGGAAAALVIVGAMHTVSDK